MTRLLVAIISRLTPPSEREWIVGDTLERLDDIERARGFLAARRWLVRESLRVLMGAHAHRHAVTNRELRHSRDRGGFRHQVEQLVDDTRYFFRRSVRAGAFTTTAVAVIALGIAANVAVFSIADAVLLRPAAFPDPDRVVAFETVSAGGVDLGASPVMFAHWRAQAEVVEDAAAFRYVMLNDISGTKTEQVRGSLVSAAYFRVFAASLARGRTFNDLEDRPGGGNVAVISHAFWTQRFGGDDAIGARLRLNGISHTVIGVLDRSFQIDAIGPAPDVWLPLQLDMQSKTQGHFLWVCGRLRPDVTLVQARTRLHLSADQFRREFPSALPDNATFSVQPLRDALVRNARPLFLVLLGAVGVVLLIACSNIATLLLLQAAGRRREMAVRVAVGAGRWRIVRQLFTENLLLSAFGAAAGVTLGWLSLRALPAAGIPELARLEELTFVPDWRVVSFSAGLAIVTALLSGIVPALRASRIDLTAVMNADGRASHGPAQRRIEAALVALQVSLALVLLVGCGLLVRTVVGLTSVDAGFDPDRVMTMKTSLGGPQFAATTDVDALVRRGIDTLESAPGVAIAAASYGLPLEDGGGLPFEIVGRPLPPGSPFHGGAGWRAVSAGYFKTLRIPVLRGREFTSADRGASRPVVVINDVLARQQWPDEDPIGQHLVLGHGIGPQFQDEPVREIVGVVGGARENRLDASPGTQVYEPIAQLPDVSNAFVASGTSLAWMVRTTTAPEPLAPTLRQALERTSGLPISSVAPMDDIVGRSIFRQRFAMWLMASFGVSALVLASLGLYGLIGYAVEQRIPEIGIRLALGADASSIARTVLWQGLRLTIAGAVVGLFVALVLTRAMSRLLFDVSPSDPPTFVAVSLAVGLVAMLAAWLPARRASRIDPIVALRSQ